MLAGPHRGPRRRTGHRAARPRLTLCAVACVGAGWLAAPPAQAGTGLRVGDFPVRLSRALHVGARYRLTAQVTMTRDVVVTQQGQTIKREHQRYTVDYVATVQVLRVDAFGRSTREAHHVTRLVKTEQGRRTSLVPAGTVVTAQTRGRKEHIRTATGPVSADLFKIFEQLTDVTKGGPTDDQIFGTAMRKSVGDHWPIQAATARKALMHDMHLSTWPPRAHLSGQTRIVSRTRARQQDCLRIEATLNITGFTPPIGAFQVDSGTVQATLSGLFPVDPRRMAVSSAMDMTFTVQLHQPSNTGAGTFDVTVTVRTQRSRRFAPLP